MKKALLLLLALLSVFATSACSHSPNTNFAVAGVTVFYGTPIDLAKEEFAEIFAEHEVEITDTATLSRTDDATNIVVQISYTSKQGDGVYGFEFEKDSCGNWEILQHGEDVTIDNLVNIAP